MNRPIPAFYCCYLLRSKAKHAALYIGSTPNPRRRQKQHNGLTVGGAKRTSWEKFRPWDMVCLVTGFPSKTAALQFEWAWQNPHNSRHIPASERITHPRVVIKTRKGGKKYRALVRPTMSLKCRLSNLELLLRMKSFERWQLKVKCFDEDVGKLWTRCNEPVSASIRKGTKVSAEMPAHTQGPPSGVESIDVTYLPMQGQLKRSRDAFVGGMRHECSVCQEAVRPNKDLALVCPSESCRAVSHLDCLSRHFLMQEGQAGAVLPTTGECKSCGTALQWVDLMKDLSLRIRGQHVLDAVFESGGRHVVGSQPAQGVATDQASKEKLLSGIEEEDDDEDDDDDDNDDEFVPDMPGFKFPSRKSAVERAFEENSHLLEENGLDNIGSNQESAMEIDQDSEIIHHLSTPVKAGEKSDWDEAEIGT